MRWEKDRHTDSRDQYRLHFASFTIHALHSSSRVQKPNTISICSAISAQLTAWCLEACLGCHFLSTIYAKQSYKKLSYRRGTARATPLFRLKACQPLQNCAKLTATILHRWIGEWFRLFILEWLLYCFCYLIRHPRASNYYRQSTYQIWSLYLHSLRRYERRYKMSKMGWFGVVSVIQGHWK